MKDDTEVKHPYIGTHITKRKTQITKNPCCHPDKEHFLDTNPVKQEGNGKEEKSFRNLSHYHLSCSIMHPRLVKVKVCKAKIKGKGYADEYS